MDGKREPKQKTWRTPAERGLVIIMVAIVVAACTSTGPTVAGTATSNDADALTPASRTTNPPSPTPSFAEDARARFHTRWCIDVSRYLQAMKSSPRKQATTHFDQLMGSANQFRKLHAHLYSKGFPLTAAAVSQVYRTISGFIDAVTPPRSPTPPTQGWDSMLEYVREMRDPALAGNAVGRLVSSLGAC